MKITVMQEQLQKGLGHVSRAVATKTSLPVLGNILLATDQGQLKLAATNLEIGITCWVDCVSRRRGRSRCRRGCLTDFIGNLPNEAVKLELDRRTLALNVRAARSKATVRGIDAEDFPAIPTVKGSRPRWSLPMYCARRSGRWLSPPPIDESRPVLAGVQMRFSGDKLTLSAADGFRMAVRLADLVGPATEDVSIIVPAKALNELSRDPQRRDRAGRDRGDARAEPTALPHWQHRVPLATDRRLLPGLEADHPVELLQRAVVSRDQLLSAAKLASYFARDNNDVGKTLDQAGQW